MTKVSDILNAAADLLDRPGAWIKGDIAHNKDGVWVGAATDEAVCWCAMGAIEHEAMRLYGGFSDWEAVESFGDYIKTTDIGAWNDRKKRTQQEVVQALRKAAEKANG